MLRSALPVCGKQVHIFESIGNCNAVIDLPLIARKFNVDSLHVKADQAASQQMISVTANFNLHT